MAILHEYHRPETLDTALALLARTDRRLLPLAGGSRLVGELETRTHPDVDGVVDLAGLGLDTITVAGDQLVVGATATLTALVEHPVAGGLAGGLLRRAARGEGPVNLRNVATLGGIVAAAEPDSELYAALLALDAQVTEVMAGRTQTLPPAQWTGAQGLYTTVTQAAEGYTQTVPLDQLRGVQGLITSIMIPLSQGEVRGGHARVARTPADRPIVAALAVVGPKGHRVALCGVAPRPVLAGTPLDPPDDFKGSAAYRRAMAEVVTARALAEAK